MISELSDLLACPACHRELIGGKIDLLCTSCARSYPLVQEVPVFLPDGDAVVTVPADHDSNAMGAEFIERLARGEEVVLHIGAGGTAQKYPRCVEFEHKIFRHTDVVGDAHALPFRDECFDRVLAFNVFEHLRKPALAAAEIGRVLKPGGTVVIHTAFLQPLHEAPAHFYNATEFGIRHWFEKFQIESCRVSPNFTIPYMLAFLLSHTLQAVESGAGSEARAEVGRSTLQEWAEFWRDRGKLPSTFALLQNLPNEAQSGVSAGFELIARKV